jgi:hypothetical protein
MRYQGVEASAIFSFNMQGELTMMVTERYRGVGGRFVLGTLGDPDQRIRGISWRPDTGPG